MKKTLVAIILMLAFIVSVPVLSFASGFDVSVLKNSDYFISDSSTGAWKAIAGYHREYKDVDVSMYVFLSSSYVEKGWGPDLRVSYYDKDNEVYDKIDGLRFIVDDKIYSFGEFEEGETSSFVFGGETMRAFLNSLSSALEVSFVIDHTTVDGDSYTATIDSVSYSELEEIIEIAQLLEDSNLWDPSVTTDYYENDQYYEASVSDNPSYDKSKYDSEEGIYLAMKTAYEKENYDSCLQYCNRLGNYKDTYNYMLLAIAHNWPDYCSTEEDVAELSQLLIQQIDFEDSKDLLVSNIFFAIPYLKGYWVGQGGGATFEMKENGGYITTIPVVPQSGDSFDFSDGIIYKYFSNNPSRRTPNLQIIPISETEIYIYSFQMDLYYQLNKIR